MRIRIAMVAAFVLCFAAVPAARAIIPIFKYDWTQDAGTTPVFQGDVLVPFTDQGTNVASQAIYSWEITDLTDNLQFNRGDSYIATPNSVLQWGPADGNGNRIYSIAPDLQITMNDNSATLDIRANALVESTDPGGAWILASPVPEPGSLTLVWFGLLILVIICQRKADGCGRG